MVGAKIIYALSAPVIHSAAQTPVVTVLAMNLLELYVYVSTFLTPLQCSTGGLDCVASDQVCFVSSGVCQVCTKDDQCLFLSKCVDGLCSFSVEDNWWVVVAPLVSLFFAISVAMIVMLIRKRRVATYQTLPVTEWEATDDVEQYY